MLPYDKSSHTDYERLDMSIQISTVPKNTITMPGIQQGCVGTELRSRDQFLSPLNKSVQTWCKSGPSGFIHLTPHPPPHLLGILHLSAVAARWSVSWPHNVKSETRAYVNNSSIGCPLPRSYCSKDPTLIRGRYLCVYQCILFRTELWWCILEQSVVRV